jgi:dTDP-glucose 4,6-dehydratase
MDKYDNYNIVNLDKLTYCGNLDNLKDIEKDKRYKFLKGDIADGEFVRQAIKGCDIVVNFAAETHVDRSITDPYSFVKTNVLGAHTLLEAAKVNRVEKFIQISTDEVYGSIEKGSFKEIDPLLPNSPYSAAKARGDLLARSYFTTFKLPVVITRSSNNFGPYQYPEKIIPLFITNLLQGKKIPLYGDGKNVRDWLFVTDNCEAIDTVLHKGQPGQAYNIGAGNEIANLELTRTILDLLGKDKNFVDFVADRPGHDRRYSVDISRISALGWKPRHDFSAAIRLTVDWYKKNEDWWRRLAECRKSIEY